jgi:agmatine deiminase
MELTPQEAGLRMPAEWAPHARCWMAWPHRPDLWGESLPEAQRGWARVARAIARFEPVGLIAHPAHAEEASRLCGAFASILPLEIDDAWARDTGPAFLVGAGGARAATAWRFNGWGGKFEETAEDAQLAARLAAHLALPLYRSPLCLEGGALAVDGEGTVLTTESCVLNANRNPGLTRREVERELCRALGASKVIWLPGELHPGDVTDGHVDGLACFARPGLVLMETRTDPDSPRAEVLRENLRAIRRATDARGRSLEIVEIEDAWEAQPDGPGPGGWTAPEGGAFCISYVNFYVANGGVVMPAYGIPADVRARAAIEKAFPEREVVQVDVRGIAIGGGGIHCITQQQPA